MEVESASASGGGEGEDGYRVPAGGERFVPKKAPVMPGLMIQFDCRGLLGFAGVCRGGSWAGCLLAADFTADAAATIEDLAAALGCHAGTEADSAAAFDVADSSWVVHCHRQISSI